MPETRIVISDERLADVRFVVLAELETNMRRVARMQLAACSREQMLDFLTDESIEIRDLELATE